jgi:hypothetical protein
LSLFEALTRGGYVLADAGEVPAAQPHKERLMTDGLNQKAAASTPETAGARQPMRPTASASADRAFYERVTLLRKQIAQQAGMLTKLMNAMEARGETIGFKLQKRHEPTVDHTPPLTLDVPSPERLMALVEKEQIEMKEQLVAVEKEITAFENYVEKYVATRGFRSAE